ncbi:hypothetical protein BaRGS_00028335 [Batillaria attramentaria]|uniref:Uncharacterized protein n=1 Tax=Batillaria attramentaria TaxID=370345 RepID=A0ABD0K081_9CAEN
MEPPEGPFLRYSLQAFSSSYRGLSYFARNGADHWRGRPCFSQVVLFIGNRRFFSDVRPALMSGVVAGVVAAAVSDGDDLLACLLIPRLEPPVAATKDRGDLCTGLSVSQCGTIWDSFYVVLHW